MIRYMLDTYVEKFVADEISLDQLYTNFLVGLKTLSEAIAKRVEAQYKKSRLITPEQLIVVFRLIGYCIDKRIKDPEERRLLAMDIGAVIKGQTAGFGDGPRPDLGVHSAVALIDDAVDH